MTILQIFAVRDMLAEHMCWGHKCALPQPVAQSVVPSGGGYHGDPNPVYDPANTVRVGRKFKSVPDPSKAESAPATKTPTSQPVSVPRASKLTGGDMAVISNKIQGLDDPTKFQATKEEYLERHKYIMDKYKGGSWWEHAEEDVPFDTKKYPRQALFASLGVTSAGYQGMERAYAVWSAIPDPGRLDPLVKQLVKGDLSNPTVRAMAVEQALTQRILGNEPQTLYRGVAGQTSVQPSSHAFESWTSSRRVAEEFANGRMSTAGPAMNSHTKLSGLLLEAKVPASAILTSYRTSGLFQGLPGQVHPRQSEYLVAPGLGKPTMTRTKTVAWAGVTE